MLLTLKPPLQNGSKTANEQHSGQQEPNTSVQRFSFTSSRDNQSVAPPSQSTTPTSAPAASSQVMETSYRNLPPPASMSLPPSEHGVPAASDMAQLPPPPAQWKNADESMRQWLYAKAEVDRRRQEEEKTRQESLKLDQRKVEQGMLRDSLQGGVPPHLVPLIFAGLGGGSNLANSALESAQNYAAQMGLQQPQQQQQSQQTQAQQQPLPPQQQPPQSQAQPSQQQIQQHQHHQPPPPPPPPQHSTLEVCRESRMIPPNPYGAQQTVQSGGQAAPAPRQMSSPSTQQPFGRGQPIMQSNPTPTSRAPPTPLSRINTADMHVHPSGASQYGPPSGQQQSQGPPSAKTEQSQAAPQQQQQTPSSIYFHHWVPPNQNMSQPNTPSAKTQQDSPLTSQTQSSHLRIEYQSSPKKRKAQGGHQPAPPPSSQPSDPSPAQSPRRSSPGPGVRRGGGHLRHRSDATPRTQDSRHRDSLEAARVGEQSQLMQNVRSETHGVPDRGSNSDRDQSKGMTGGDPNSREDTRNRGTAPPPSHHQPPQTHVFHHHNPHATMISTTQATAANNDTTYTNPNTSTSSGMGDSHGVRTRTSA